MALGAAAGVALPLSDELRLTLAIEQHVQLGTPTHAGVLVMPLLAVGASAW